MKNITRLVFAVLLGLMLTLFVGCEEKKEETPVEEISYIAEEASLNESFKDTAASYLAAVKKHDHTAVTMFTTSDFVMNYDETGFYEYCRNITGFSISEIDLSHVTEENGKYSVPVTYTLTYDSPFIDSDGESQDSGEYSYHAFFIMVEEADGFKISDITERAMG